MRLTKASIASGVSQGMILHYEKAGLLPRVRRMSNGYRDYSQDDVMRLRFINAFSDLGFKIDDIKELLAPWDDQKRPPNEVKAIALRKAHELEHKAQILEAAKRALLEMAELGEGKDRPAAPVQTVDQVIIQG